LPAEPVVDPLPRYELAFDAPGDVGRKTVEALSRLVPAAAILDGLHAGFGILLRRETVAFIEDGFTSSVPSRPARVIVVGKEDPAMLQARVQDVGRRVMQEIQVETHLPNKLATLVRKDPVLYSRIFDSDNLFLVGSVKHLRALLKLR
jgi:hypothetical protein